MLNFIIALIISILVAVCCYQVAKMYGSKFSNTCARMRHNEKHGGCVYYCDLLDYWRYLVASLLFDVITLIAVISIFSCINKFFS